MLAWVDVETTGLEPQDDFLLEVGLMLTDDQLHELDRVSIVLPWYTEHTEWYSEAAMEMHTKNGLLAECQAVWQAAQLSMDDCERLLVNWLHDRLDEPPPMCGSTVSFDRAWLKAEMPELFACFHYRNIDVSSIKELNRRWLFAPEWEGARDLHRVLPDLEDSVAELNHYSRGFTIGAVGA